MLDLVNLSKSSAWVKSFELPISKEAIQSIKINQRQKNTEKSFIREVFDCPIYFQVDSLDEDEKCLVKNDKGYRKLDKGDSLLCTQDSLDSVANYCNGEFKKYNKDISISEKEWEDCMNSIGGLQMGFSAFSNLYYACAYVPGTKYKGGKVVYISHESSKRKSISIISKQVLRPQSQDIAVSELNTMKHPSVVYEETITYSFDEGNAIYRYEAKESAMGVSMPKAFCDQLEKNSEANIDYAYPVEFWVYKGRFIFLFLWANSIITLPLFLFNQSNIVEDLCFKLSNYLSINFSASFLIILMACFVASFILMVVLEKPFVKMICFLSWWSNIKHFMAKANNQAYLENLKKKGEKGEKRKEIKKDRLSLKILSLLYKDKAKCQKEILKYYENFCQELENIMGNPEGESLKSNRGILESSVINNDSSHVCSNVNENNEKSSDQPSLVDERLNPGDEDEQTTASVSNSRANI